MRPQRALAVLALLAATLGWTPTASASTGDDVTKTYTADSAHGGLTRSYLVHVPPGPAHSGRPVVVFLHGCNQTAEQARDATRFDELADARDFIVVYPMQVQAQNSSAPVADGNGIGCWNWFLPEDQERDAGEPGVLAGLTRQVVADNDADASQVYVEGISAGAAMSVILAATYPDVYAAAASLSGCTYRTCSDLSGALIHEAMGPRARVVPLFVENGTADTLNPAAQSEALVQSWLGADDLADDDAANGSVSRQSSDVTYSPDGVPSPGSGDPCIHNNTWTCPGGVLGLSNYPYTVSTYPGDIVELWLIHGMAHAQPHSPTTGPNTGGPYTDPLGPDITLASYEFFQRHPMPAAPVLPESPVTVLLPVVGLLIAGIVVVRRRTS